MTLSIALWSIFQQRITGWILKGVLAFSLVVALGPHLLIEWQQNPLTEEQSPLIWGLLAQELMIGVALGALLRIFWTSGHLVGELLSSTLPEFSIQNTKMLGSQHRGQIQQLFFIALFVTLDGHVVVMEGLIRSFDWFPILSTGGDQWAELMRRGLIGAGGLFLITFTISLPCLVAAGAAEIITQLAWRLSPSAFGEAPGLALRSLVVFVALLLTMREASILLSHWLFEAMDILFSGVSF